MSSKGPRPTYEADGSGVSNSNTAPFVAFGTAFPVLDPKTRDDGSYVLVWKKGVTDEPGKQRVHGAFTEGLSAGYFNTVGSKEGRTLSTFKSSRVTRMKAARAQPEGFMDEGTLSEATVVQNVEKTSGFSGIGSTEEELGHRVKQVTLLGLPTPAVQDTMDAKLLERVAWKEGQGIGSNAQGKAAIDGAVDDTGKTYLFAPTNSAVVTFTRKNDSKGLGYVGEDRLQQGKESETERPAAKEKKRKGGGFGVGVLNDDGEDDEDPYEIQPKNAYNRVVRGGKKRDTIVKEPVRHGPVSSKRKLRSAQRHHDILSHESTPAAPVPSTMNTYASPSLSTTAGVRSRETSSPRSRLLRPLLRPPPAQNLLLLKKLPRTENKSDMPGKLIRPPYQLDDSGNWKRAAGQPAGSVVISTTQYHPLQSRRQSANPLRKMARKGKKRMVLCNDREVEAWLNRRMSLLPDERAACEDARKHGKGSFKAIQDPERMLFPESSPQKAMIPSVRPALAPSSSVFKFPSD